MQVNQKAVNRDKKHAENLKLKLERELPKEFVEEHDDLAHLEAKKTIVDSIHKDHDTHKKREKEKAIKYELEASELEDLPIK